jgi:hypothetical protein
MVIHREPETDTKPKFVRVSFSLPCNKSPEWISAETPNKKFHLVRQKSCDAAFEDSTIDDSSGNQIHLSWKYTAGVKPFTLPSSQVLPCYYSMDMPLVPVV